MTDYLPADIWREILLKLPVVSLIRFTAVCKSWKALILSPAFIYAHLSLSKNHSFNLRRYEELDMDDDYLSRNFMASGNNGSFEIRDSLSSRLPFESHTGWYRIVGSCDGIVCLTYLRRVILWNPSVRNHVVLPQSTTNPKEPHEVLLGFGVANHVYKVVRLVYCPRPDRYGVDVPPQAEIFSIGMEGWRSVPGFDIKLRGSDSSMRQVFLNGIIHWIGYEPIAGSWWGRSSILTFDIGDEVFGEVMLPDELEYESCLYKIGGSLAVMGSCTYFYRDPYELAYDCDVWVMEEYGVKASWTKLYTIDLDEEYRHYDASFYIIGFKSDEALLDYYHPDDGYRRLVSYNLETQLGTDLETSGKPRLYIDDYVESLLLLKGNSVPAVGEIGEALMEGLDINKE